MRTVIDPRDAAWRAVQRVHHSSDLSAASDEIQIIEQTIYRLATTLAQLLQKEQDKGRKQFYYPVP